MTERCRGKECKIKFDLIITIVNKGRSRLVVEAAKNAGAEGGTVLGGRGTGVREKAKLLGITIEPEKEIILTLVPREDAEDILDAIIKEAELNKPGKGISFILEVKRVAGITHLLDDELRDKLEDNL
ncbi:P-II family nitrogen regulator [Natranaerobius thermophilus]|uniref:Nitrogen regulatory protein P-II n=1 Tax=Natranaerobius thermophilus (strain ATCC BAA-1301 / DSM 18059 / JW/NM-WN-LF) TaxID=457570 RepID=B2A5A7_NATTJ|nr:P-II family nitrogen regulator [Natranaerobius thermophilus]ACB83941.1 nitrogen regulatory protein P-II [Natranaerobius thermophilus JW/NM-WN-LF]